MMKLEELLPNAAVRGIIPDALVTVVNVQWFGSEALELTYKTPTGKVANELLYRHDEPRLELVEQGRPWSFDGDGALFRLVSEAQRIRLAHLFDPVLAVHTSVVDPLPHQITAVYEAMLPRQPLRFLLADDPGAGKTIMAGLLIKELIVRGDLQRCLIVCPGSLAEQWQDELYRRFHLPFDILTNDKLEAARIGNWFLETNLVIARLDKLSRNEVVQQKLQAPDCRWDLVVCDEAHKMSATVFGGETKYTKRYRLGQMLSTLTRHFLLMTATPHNGKEADFQLFMALLDGDRFEGRFRDGVHMADVSDLMRRMVKESLLKFDGTPLFPERIAYTVPYKLSQAEAQLYKSVTDYVRDEFNRAEALENDRRAGTVGFALTILQRRLASSPEAIYQSLRRRRERLESRLRELELLQRGGQAEPSPASIVPTLDADDVEDLEDAPDNEVEAAEEEILDQATAARSMAELRAEIETLKTLEALALGVRRSGADTKWRELASLLGEIFTPAAIANRVAETHAPFGSGEIPRPTPSPRQKLVIFTEHRDTLNYLHSRITSLLGRTSAVVTIHGGVGREERLKVQEAFRHGERPEVKAYLTTVLDHALDRNQLQELLEERALAHDAMDASLVRRVREGMERAEARRLQPHYIESFFHEAFQRLGGSVKRREPRRYEITHVPATVRNRDRLIGIGEPVLQRYERIAFEKSLVAPQGQPLAAFVCPGHPLLDSVIDLTLERHRDLLKRGCVLVDELDTGIRPRVLFYLEHAIQDAGVTRAGERRVVSKRMLYVELDADGNTRHLHYAPYLDYRPLARGEPDVEAILNRPEYAWIDRELEKKAQGYAVAQVVPEHLAEVRGNKLALIAKTEAAVKDRLTKEISYWDHRAEQLKLQEQAGKVNAKLNSGEARKRADNLQGRLQKRLEELKLEAQISPLPPVVLGGFLVLPLGLVKAMTGTPTPGSPVDTQASAARARAIIMEVERDLGFEPTDREFEKLGYDIESRVTGTGKLRFLEVKGRIQGAETITVTRNEILYSLNKPEDFILAIVEFLPDGDHGVHYLRQPFKREPDFGVTSVNYSFAELLAQAGGPS